MILVCCTARQKCFGAAHAPGGARGARNVRIRLWRFSCTKSWNSPTWVVLLQDIMSLQRRATLRAKNDAMDVYCIWITGRGRLAGAGVSYACAQRPTRSPRPHATDPFTHTHTHTPGLPIRLPEQGLAPLTPAPCERKTT